METQTPKQKRRLSRKAKKRIALFKSFLIVAGMFATVYGAYRLYTAGKWYFFDSFNVRVAEAVQVPHGERYPVQIFDVEGKTIRETTAYNAGDPGQTDGSPCISADGSNICNDLARGEKICAANFVPLGSRLYMQGVGVCTVKDRMNIRFRSRVDVAMQADEKERAVGFGKQNLEVYILK